MPLKRPTTTPLPDEIYDEWAPQLGEAELKALLYIVRRTLGFHKSADAISLNQFLKGIITHDGRVLDRGCGVKSRPNVVRALKSLEDKGLIRSTKARAATGDSEVTIYALRWEGDEDVEAAPEGGFATKPGGSFERTPRWFRSDPEVVSEQHQGGFAAKPTTNSITTNSQQDRYTRGTIPFVFSDPRRSGTNEAADQDPAPAAEAVIVWRAVLAQAGQTMTAKNYDRWFAPTLGLRLEGNDLTVSVPTEMHRHWLDVRLRQRIEDTLRLLRYTDVRVTFTVAIDGSQDTCPRAQFRGPGTENTRRRQLP